MKNSYFNFVLSTVFHIVTSNVNDCILIYGIYLFSISFFVLILNLFPPTPAPPSSDTSSTMSVSEFSFLQFLFVLFIYYPLSPCTNFQKFCHRF